MSAGAGFDPGRSYLRCAEARVRKGGVELLRYLRVEVGPNERPQDAAASLPRLKSAPMRVGLSGADVMVRYLPVPAVEDWRLERLMSFEVREIESRSGAKLATSYNLLPVPKELDEEDTILLALVREDLLNEWAGALRGMNLQGFSPSAIALYNAYLALGDHEPAVTLLANVGAGTLDLALVRGSELYFARSVTTGLEKRDRILAERLGVDAARAQRLIHKHLDLGAALGKHVDADTDRVTRPLLPLYDPLPTLFGSMVTLCKAQARLRDLALDRVLLCGGGAATQGLPEFLTERLRVPVTVWNPSDVVDAASLPEDQAAALSEDGPGAAVALGLALSAADADLYALEILPETARRKRSFRERGVYAVAAGGLAAAFLVASFVVTSQRAGQAEEDARRLGGEAAAAESSHARGQQLVEQLGVEEKLHQELSTRYAVRRSLEEMLAALSAGLPEELWVDSFQVEVQAGDEWGLKGQQVPVVSVSGHGVDGAKKASTLFAEFAEKLKAQLPGGESAVRPEARPRGRDLDWTLRAVLLHGVPPAGAAIENAAAGDRG
ncbi:MAG: hypothetical protein EYC70_03200 [Planctomycetota bacterium]|nr:MAG: hypothetical protein EYC70_03200 [Planctomycetota bacterium]